jgi:hypothetical protein
MNEMKGIVSGLACIVLAILVYFFAPESASHLRIFVFPIAFFRLVIAMVGWQGKRKTANF